MGLKMGCDAPGVVGEVVAQGKKTQDMGDRARHKVRDKERGNEREEEQKYCRQAEGEGLC